jgi:hypothetical protein
MVNLGFMYMRKAKSTLSFEQYERAAHWFRYAISEDQSLQDPQYYLGLLFEKGFLKLSPLNSF